MLPHDRTDIPEDKDGGLLRYSIEKGDIPVSIITPDACKLILSDYAAECNNTHTFRVEATLSTYSLYPTLALFCLNIPVCFNIVSILFTPLWTYF